MRHQICGKSLETTHPHTEETTKHICARQADHDGLHSCHVEFPVGGKKFGAAYDGRCTCAFEWADELPGVEYPGTNVAIGKME